MTPGYRGKDKETHSIVVDIVVGGVLAGSALAGLLAQAGLGVMVVEREAGFRDRIRGELTWPWGVAEARAVGEDPEQALRDALRRAGA